MRRLGTALAALAAVMAGLTYASAPATSAPADEAIQRLGGCLSSGGQVGSCWCWTPLLRWLTRPQAARCRRRSTSSGN